MKRERSVLIAAVAAWCAGVIIAPLFAGSGLSDLLYRLYHIVCHQFDSRSFHLQGAPFGVCIRCTAIYGGFLATVIAVHSSERLRTVRWHLLPLAAATAVPMAWDGLLSLFGLAEATTASRLITGALFGTGLALMLHDVLCESLYALFHHLDRYHGTTTR